MSEPDDVLDRSVSVIDTFLWNRPVRWHVRSATHIWLDANAKYGIAQALTEAGLLKTSAEQAVLDAAVAWLEWPVTMRDELAEAVRTYLEDTE